LPLFGGSCAGIWYYLQRDIYIYIFSYYLPWASPFLTDSTPAIHPGSLHPYADDQQPNAIIRTGTHQDRPTVSMPLPTTALRSVHRAVNTRCQQLRTMPTTSNTVPSSNSIRHCHPIATALVAGCYITASASLIAEVACVLSKDDVGVRDPKGYEWAKASGLLMGFYEG